MRTLSRNLTIAVGLLSFHVIFAAAPRAGAASFLIELDYMANSDHSHRPSQFVIDAVVEMFACRGHQLTIIVDDEIPHHNVMVRDPNNCNEFFDYDGATNSFGRLRDQHFDLINNPAAQYCIFGHFYQDSDCNLTDSSGLAEGPGRYFIVTLADHENQVGSEFKQAATLAHEFGHTLGLSHCGPDDCDTLGNHNPLLPSVMSYRYQLSGVRNVLKCNNIIHPKARFKQLDYSAGNMCSLNENSINEIISVRMGSTDWDCDGTFESNVVADISNGDNGDSWCGETGIRSTVHDTDEWAIVAGAGLALERGERPPKRRDYECLPRSEADKAAADLGRGGLDCGDAQLELEGCLGDNVFVGLASPFPRGACTQPWPNPMTAQSASLNYSTYFLFPGSYTLAGNRKLTRPGIWVAASGAATFR